jgi:subfamily B ATP-binding cassette protein MsbA
MAEHASTWQVYRRLLGYVRRYRLRFAIGVLAGILGGGTLFPLLQASGNLLVPFENAAGSGAAVNATNAPPVAAGSLAGLGDIQKLADKVGVKIADENERLTWMGLALVLLVIPVLAVLRSVGNYLNRYCMRWVGARMVCDLRNDLFDQLQRQSLKFFGKSDVGELISRCTNDAGIIESVVATTAADLTRAPFEIAAALAFVVVFSIQNQLLGTISVVALVFPLCIFPIIFLGRYVKRYTHRALERVSDLVSRMHENFTGIRVVKAFHMEAEESRRFSAMNASYFRYVIKALRSELAMAPLMEGVALVLGCAFFVICFAKGVRLSQIVPVALAAVVVYRPFKQLAQLSANVQRGAAALDRIFNILDTDTSLPEPLVPVKKSGFDQRIVFEDVSFAYEPAGALVIDRAAIEIPKGTVIALVGETGSGKTTLANLLARFYDPTAGVIRMDGVDLRDMDVASLRRMIGVVTQETVLFNDTIAANIAYGTQGATLLQIEAAARMANAHEFIMRDPEGYGRVVGEKGFVLSGGERQRVSIARAILKNPPILILDEATSALDTVTERLVQEAISRVMQNRTVFAIAHRLSTVRHANQILLLDRGRIVERGTHEVLYAAGGRYRKLCDMQLLDV